MLAIPSALQAQFEECLRNKAIPNRLHGAYKKWLRYYLDFCRKYDFPPLREDSLPHFIDKLQGTKQTKIQQEHAAMAIRLYYELLDPKTPLDKEPLSQSHHHAEYSLFNDERQVVIGEATRPV